ncbi:CBM96 family carbohydrate-binding protein [Dyadobacter sediminis]|nr:malectin domain-containing carbohydrate-binding protein [Dyadobacter sediminis]GGB78702.1 hypothetical protein GCM10011325_02790 [Dyadobacter sediminis]
MAGNVQRTFAWLKFQKCYGRIYKLQTALYAFLLLMAFFVTSAQNLLAQPAIQRDKTFGGYGSERFSSIQQTGDGGYILAGDSQSDASGDKSENNRGDYDYWIVKLSANGTKQWDKTFGGTDYERLKTVRQSPDGGYYLAGGSKSSAGGDKSQGVVGLFDLWIIKLDPNGNLEWEKTIAMAESEQVEDMELTPDGGMIIACDYTPGQEQENNWHTARIVKLSRTGELEWSKDFSGDILLMSLAPTADGGYILGANTSVSDRYIAIKISSNATVQWTKEYGGVDYSSLREIKQTSEGGYIISGNSTAPAGGDKTESSYKYDYWVIKITSDGTKEWDKTIHAAGDDNQWGVIQTSDGGYVVAGSTTSGNSLDKTEPSHGHDLWLVKLSAGGGIVWDKTIGGSSNDLALSNGLIATRDGGLAVAGESNSAASGDKTENSRGDYDFWIVKLAPEQTLLPTTPIRINAGGPEFTTATKKKFSADLYYSGIDRVSSIVTGDISNTSNDILYQSARCSPSFSYNIPVANGTFDIYLHFAETYFGAPGKKGGKGSRQFHVNMEGSRKLTNYDIFVKAGGAMRATAETFTVNVTDGMLNIDFLTGAADLPRISAIEVIPVTSVTLKPVADAYVRDGSYSAANYGYLPELDVKNATGDASVKRSSYIRFQLPQSVKAGSAKLRIYGHNHENSKSVSVHAYGVNNDTWTENGIVKNNAPAASSASLGYVAVNNAYKYYEIDVTSYVKAQQASGETLVSLMLTDPNNRNIRLVFNSKEAGSYPPELIIQPSPVVNSNTRLSNEETSSNLQAEPESSSVYPNPVGKQFSVLVSSKHGADISFDLLNNAGKSYSIATAEKARAGQKAEVDISGLSLNSGIYLLKIRSEAATEVIKVLVTD